MTKAFSGEKCPAHYDGCRCSLVNMKRLLSFLNAAWRVEAPQESPESPLLLQSSSEGLPQLVQLGGDDLRLYIGKSAALLLLFILVENEASHPPSSLRAIFPDIYTAQRV